MERLSATDVINEMYIARFRYPCTSSGTDRMNPLLPRILIYRSQQQRLGIRNSVNRFQLSISLTDLTKDYGSPNNWPNNILLLYRVFGSKIIAGQPSMSGFLLHFAISGQYKNFWFATNSYTINIRYGNSSENVWSSWRSISITY